jgi:hypothetical protein
MTLSITNEKLFFLLPDNFNEQSQNNARKETEAKAQVVYDLYLNYWSEWVDSPICFLDKTDLKMVQMWYACHNQFSIANTFNLSPSSVRQRLKKAFYKMDYYKRHLIDFFDLQTEEARLEYLQNAPIPILACLTVRSRNTLGSIAENLNDLVEVVGTDISKFKGVGPFVKKDLIAALDRLKIPRQFS